MGDRLAMLEEELFNLGEAIEYLGQVRGCEDVIGELEDKVKVLSVERDMCHRRAAEEAEREVAALEREYYKGLM